jgi:hypothetical protein
MANVTDNSGGVLDPPVQPSGFLHPILLAFLNSLPNPNLTIMQHPAFPILTQTHPDQTAVASYQAPPVGGFTPQPTLTSPTGFATAAAAPRTDPTASSAAQITPVGTPAGSSGTDAFGMKPNQLQAPVGNPTPGVPNPAATASPNQPFPQTGPNASMPIGNSSMIGQDMNSSPGMWNANPRTLPPINFAGGPNGSNPNNANASGVMAGPQALNHVPYGPELTGLSGYGGLITPNGTPVAMSMWQKMGLDPTSISRYNSYVSDVAGMNPADLAQIGMSETSNKMTDLKAPIKFSGANNQIAAPAGG